MILRYALLAIAVASAGPAAADVAVRYAPAGPVSDFVYRSPSERDAVFRELAAVLTRLARDQLPQGRSLSVELLDVRPAGRIDPFPSAGRVRVMTGATPPSVKLRYRLTDHGRIVASGEETVSDLGYLENPAARASLSSFPYERELIRDWFRNRIVRLRPPLR